VEPDSLGGLSVEPDKQPSRREILVIGNSHTTAIALGLSDSTRERIDVVNLAAYFDPVLRGNKLLPAEIARLYQPQRIYCTFGGSEHSVFGLLESPKRFDFRVDEAGGVEPGRELVPYGLVRGTIERAMRNAMNNTRELAKLFNCPIVHLRTPPPFREIEGKATLPRIFQENMDLGITPASIRRKLYDVHSDIARKTCAAMNVGFMEVPPECVDADGFLLREYWSKDPTHGNARYGALVIDQILGASHG
jgi:hypothetical protein